MKAICAAFILFCCVATASHAAGEEEFARMDMLLSIGGCRIVDFESFLALLSPAPDRAYAVTNNAFSPPFVVKARVRTDSTNIRFYYSAAEIILNWEVRQDELRFHNPLTGNAKAFPGMGHVTPMEWHDIVWEVRPTSTRLLVDGEVRLDTIADFRGLSAPIGIGPAFESLIMLKSLTVLPLEGEAAEPADPLIMNAPPP